VLYVLPLPLTSYTIYLVQLLSFLVLSFLFQWPIVKMYLVPSRIKRRRASRLAREQFFEQGMHLTNDRTGILIFVSVAERYVEIIADAGIDEIVSSSTWQGIINALVVDIKSDRVAEGFVEAVRACGNLLSTSFPRSTEDHDELPNRLVEL
jgi:putative membrane protein